MKKNIFLLFILLITLTNCKDNSLEKDIFNNIDTESTPKKISGDGRFDLLGFGYDPTIGYLDPQQHRQSRVIDVERLYIESPALFYSGNPGSSLTYIIDGEDFDSWSIDIKNKFDISAPLMVENLKIGTTKMNMDINLSGYVSSRYSYATFYMLKILKVFQLKHSIEELRNYLDPYFIYCLNNLSASRIVELYGTHVFTQVSLGGKLEVDYKSKINSSQKKAIVNQGISYEVEKAFEINASNSLGTVLKDSNKFVSCYYRTIGGDPTKSIFGEITVTSPSLKLNLNNWSSSLNLDNSQTVEIDNNSLIPIYEFVSDPNKRNELKLAIEQYLNSKNIYSISGTIKCSFPLNKSYDKLIPLDFNGDKIMDLICFSPGYGMVCLNEGLKDGTFINKVTSSNGICGYDFMNINDQVTVFDYNGDGFDDLFCYRPVQKTVFILKSIGAGNYQKVFESGSNYGFMGFDFADVNDKAISLDYNGDGFDDIICYRPGKKISYIFKSLGNGNFSLINNSAAGIGSFDLSSINDKITSLDYNNDNFTDLICYRPGNKIVQILKSNGNGTFSTTLSSSNGIGGYDLADINDQIISLDYNNDQYDDLICYRPSKGIIHILKSNGNASFANIFQSSNGICNFDLKNSKDKIISLDYNNDGKYDIIGYRPIQGFTNSARSIGSGYFSLEYSN